MRALVVILFILLNLVLGYDWFNIAGVITVGFTLHVFRRKRVLNSASELVDRLVCEKLFSRIGFGYVPASEGK